MYENRIGVLEKLCGIPFVVRMEEVCWRSFVEKVYLCIEDEVWVTSHWLKKNVVKRMFRRYGVGM